MTDHPLADVSDVDETTPTMAGAPEADVTWSAVNDQLDRVLPRLTAIGARVAVLAPILVGLDSYGRGISC